MLLVGCRCGTTDYRVNDAGPGLTGALWSDIMIDMRTISVSVDDADYQAFRRAARQRGRSTAQLIREAMATYRTEHLERGEPLLRLPVFPGHKPRGRLPARHEVYDEMFGR